MSTANRVAIVTGGNRGIGRSVILHLAERGVSSIFSYNTHADEAQEVVNIIGQLRNGVRASAIQLDLARSSTIESFFGQVEKVLKEWQLDHIDFLVNNAGVILETRLVDAKPDSLDLLWNVSLKGPFLMVMHAIPFLAKNSKILNISSALTRLASIGGEYSMYAAVKGGVEVLTRYIANDLGPKGITANTITLGAVATDFGNGYLRDNRETVGKWLESVTALRRVADADDMGRMIASFLSSEDNGWVTGANIEVTGGQQL